jgi:hypothetical protein
LRADQFAHFVDDGLALLVPRLDRAAHQAALHAAGRLRQFAVAADEGAGEVGAAGDVAPPDVFGFIPLSLWERVRVRALRASTLTPALSQGERE